MSLPSAWVDRIFDKLTLTYGHHFLGRWSGLDLEAVKADWAHELSGFKNRPDAIAHALRHLPTDNPPSVRQFMAACISAPLPAVKALPAPDTDAEFVGELMGRLNAAKAAVKRTPAQDCYANILRVVEGRGGKWTSAQRHMVQSMHEAGLVEASAHVFARRHEAVAA